MSPKKLTDEDKQEILKLYRQTPETTSTLAERFGVSSSTISRFLKSSLSETEYEDLIQEKRLARTSKPSASESPTEVPAALSNLDDWVEPKRLLRSLKSNPLDSPVVSSAQPTQFVLPLTVPTPEEPDPEDLNMAEVPTPEEPDAEDLNMAEVPTPEEPDAEDLDMAEVPTPEEPDAEDLEMAKVSPLEEPEIEDVEEVAAVDVFALGELLGEDLSDLDEDDEELDAEDEDDDWEEEPTPRYLPSLSRNADIQVLPLSAASFPKTCYLVIDRASELITRPLKEFSHLGKIPVEEVQQKTLPVFDNHRVARRFSNRSQRVIKVPDGRLLQKTCTYLYGKGITRILMDGQIYALSGTV